MKNKKNMILIFSGIGLVLVSILATLLFTGTVSLKQETDMQHYNSQVLPTIEDIEEKYRDSWYDNYVYTTTNVKKMNKSEIIQRMTWIAEDYSNLSSDLSELDNSMMSKIDREHLHQYIMNMNASLLSRMELASMIIDIANNKDIDSDEAQEHSDEALQKYIAATIQVAQITNNKKDKKENGIVD